MRMIKLSIITLSCSLSACATLSVKYYEVDDAITKKKPTKVLLSDQLYLYGKTAQMVKGYESAIAVAGEKNNYLMQAIRSSDNTPYNFFPELIGKVSPEYLLIKSHVLITNSPAAPTADLNHYHNIDLFIYDQINPSEVRSSIQLAFYKPQALTTDTEKTNLQQLGFRCNLFAANSVQNQPMLYCEKDINIQVLVAKRSEALPPLEQRFRNPVQMNFVVDKTHYNLDKAAVKALYPAAILFDIVTFPVQFGYVLYKFGKDGIGGF